MTEAKPRSILQRKAGKGRPIEDAKAMTAERGLTVALTKTAQEQFEMPLHIAEISETRMSTAELPELLEPLSLLAVMEGPSESLGLIAVPPATLSALIEMQTTGRIAPTAPPPRKPTKIDAAMAADFLDQLMQAFEAQIEALPAITWGGGFRYASFLDDPRPLGLLLEDVSFRILKVTLQMGVGNVREGGLLIALPAQGRGHAPIRAGEAPAVARAGESEAAAGGDAAQESWETALTSTVMGARVDLEAVLHRVTMPLHQAMQLKIGSELTIPYHALETLQIEAIGRRLVTSARLGQANGMRAVRVQCRDETDGDAPQMAQQAFEARHPATSTGARGAPAPSANAMPSFGGLPAGGFGTPTMNGSDLPPLASLPDLPAMGDLPLQGSLADIGELPPLGDLPILEAGGM